MTPIEIINHHIANSIERALRGESYLDPEVLKISGFATATMRHLFSNLCHLNGISYLECGTFAGASFVSAFNNNPIHAVGIDNFAQPFEETNVRGQLADNLNRWKGTARDVVFFDADCFNLEPEQLHALGLHRPFDVFYYDSEHSLQNQARALPEFLRFLADRFIYIVDDTHWDDVEKGMRSGFDTLASQVKIEQEWNLGGERPNDDDIWWNGVSIFLCTKIKLP